MRIGSCVHGLPLACNASAREAQGMTHEQVVEAAAAAGKVQKGCAALANTHSSSRGEVTVQAWKPVKVATGEALPASEDTVSMTLGRCDAWVESLFTDDEAIPIALRSRRWYRPSTKDPTPLHYGMFNLRPSAPSSDWVAR